jgi:hypothetical protein
MLVVLSCSCANQGRRQVVHFDALVNRMGALLEFFDLGQIFMNELKHDLSAFKAEAEKVICCYVERSELSFFVLSAATNCDEWKDRRIAQARFRGICHLLHCVFFVS